MEKAKIKKIFAITFTAVSITAVIVANNKEFSGGTIEAPLLATAKAIRTSSLRCPVDVEEFETASMDSSMYQTEDFEKKFIMTGDISLQVSNLGDAASTIKAWVQKHNGYISYQNENSMNMNITAHIPSEIFQSAMDECGNLGKIVNRNINSQDVTDQYYDLRTRLENERLLLEKLKGYLKEARNVDEILKVESKIADSTSSIESMESQFNRMSKEIKYCRVSFFISLPTNHNENGIIMPDTKSEFSQFLTNIVNFLLHYVWSILYIILCGTMLVTLFMFLYWLCFGKLGLVKRLFNKIK